MSDAEQAERDYKTFVVDATTYGGLLVAHYVAFRELSQVEHERAKQKGQEVFERILKVMSRVDFANRLRYLVPLDITDDLEGAYRDDLETYLLCTCLDTLAGKENFSDLGAWLKASRKPKNVGIAGNEEKHSFLEEVLLSNPPTTSKKVLEVVGGLVELYNRHYGVNKNIRLMLTSLPEHVKSEITSMYTIYKKKRGVEDWYTKTVDDKIKSIFIDYLFVFRRNKYTHTGETYPHFGGLSAMRQSLNTGNIELPTKQTIEFELDKDALVVICDYGDEALFIREVILACLAHMMEVIDIEWIARYRKAEQQRRILYALIYELQYNIAVLQTYFGILTEGFLQRDKNRPPQLAVAIAQNVLSRSNNFELMIGIPTLGTYIESALEFNKKIENLSDKPFQVLKETGIAWRIQSIRNFCENLSMDYPLWTYDLGYIPKLS